MTKAKKTTRKPRRADQALYQYYRPVRFDQVVGQEATVKTLQLAITKKSVGHAILFCGPRGTGKTSVARILAHQVNGVDYQIEADENSGQYQFDIIEIDAASNRRIEEIRQLLQNITIAPVRLEYKVYIIDEFHMLSTDSFNALLKTLEEPPDKVIFILATTEIHKVPATIISRCQRFNFRLISTEAIVDHLQSICQLEDQKISRDALEVIAIASSGSLRDSLSILSQLLLLNPDQKLQAKTVRDLIGWAPEQAVASLLAAVEDNNLAETINLLGQFYEQGIDASILSNQLMIVIRNQIKETKDASEIGRKIDWMEALLEVKLSQQPEIILETILIKQVVPSSNLQSNQPPAVKKTGAVSEKEETDEPIEVDQETEVEKTQTESTGTDVVKDDWSKVLEMIKEQDKYFYKKLESTTAVIDKSKWLIEFPTQYSYSLKVFDSNRSEGRARIAKLKKLIKESGFDCSKVEFQLRPTDAESDQQPQSRSNQSTPLEQFDQVFGG